MSGEFFPFSLLSEKSLQIKWIEDKGDNHLCLLMWQPQTLSPHKNPRMYYSHFTDEETYT